MYGGQTHKLRHRIKENLILPFVQIRGRARWARPCVGASVLIDLKKKQRERRRRETSKSTRRKSAAASPKRPESPPADLRTSTDLIEKAREKFVFICLTKIEERKLRSENLVREE